MQQSLYHTGQTYRYVAAMSRLYHVINIHISLIIQQNSIKFLIHIKSFALANYDLVLKFYKIQRPREARCIL